MGAPRAGPLSWLASLQSLRGIAAVWVVLYHLDITLWGQGLPLIPVPGARIGWLGVDLFFVLSAFLLGQPFVEGRHRPYKTFLSDRFLRIAPAYYAAALLALASILIVAAAPVRPQWVAWSLLFVSNLHVDAYFALNPAFWSLAVEMQFYLILPFLARLFVGRRWPIGLALCVATAVLVRALTFVPSEVNILFIGTFGMPAYLGHFGVGLAACRLRTVARPWLAAAVAVPIVVVPTILWIGWDSVVFGFDSLVGQAVVRPIGAAGFGLLILAAATPGGFQRSLGVAPLRWLGDISYSLYLAHIPAQFLVAHAVGVAAHPAAFAWWGFAASMAAGVALHYAVERPAERWRHQRKLRSRAQAQAALPPAPLS
jgi:peptidoglycan/LPS O-acetylase OafA/YrhL